MSTPKLVRKREKNKIFMGKTTKEVWKARNQPGKTKGKGGETFVFLTGN